MNDDDETAAATETENYARWFNPLTSREWRKLALGARFITPALSWVYPVPDPRSDTAVYETVSHTPTALRKEAEKCKQVAHHARKALGIQGTSVTLADVHRSADRRLARLTYRERALELLREGLDAARSHISSPRTVQGTRLQRLTTDKRQDLWQQAQSIAAERAHLLGVDLVGAAAPGWQPYARDMGREALDDSERVLQEVFDSVQPEPLRAYEFGGPTTEHYVRTQLLPALNRARAQVDSELQSVRLDQQGLKDTATRAESGRRAELRAERLDVAAGEVAEAWRNLWTGLGLDKRTGFLGDPADMSEEQVSDQVAYEMGKAVTSTLAVPTYYDETLTPQMNRERIEALEKLSPEHLELLVEMSQHRSIQDDPGKAERQVVERGSTGAVMGGPKGMGLN